MLSRQQKNRELYAKLEIEKADIQKRLDSSIEDEIEFKRKAINSIISSLKAIALSLVASKLYDLGKSIGWW